MSTHGPRSIITLASLGAACALAAACSDSGSPAADSSTGDGTSVTKDLGNGDGPWTADGPTGADSGSGCLAASIKWRQDGGMVAYRDKSALTNCTGFSMERSGTQTLSCSDTLAVDDPKLIAVLAALRRTDVKAALKTSPTVYGHDSRPADGVVTIIEVDSQSVIVGNPCGAHSNCTPIPEGVAQLEAAVDELTKAQVAKPACSAFAP